jgi:hypothetical protein
MSGPIECTSIVTRIVMNLGCLKMANLAYIEGDVPILGLDYFVHAHILLEELDHSLSKLYGRKEIWLPNRTFDCTLVKVLHCSLIGWERHATASQDHLALVVQLAWRQHSRPQLHRRLPLRNPSGTLGMGVATRVTMRVVVTTPLMVTPSLASKPEPLPLLGTWTGTPLWSGTSVMGIGRLEHQMDDFAHVQTEMQASIDSQTSMMHDSLVISELTLMFKSFKDLSLGRCLVPRYESALVMFRSQLFQSSCHLSCPSYHYRCHDC